MELGLKDKIVLVTGGSKGIGKAIAAGFAAEGAKLLLPPAAAPIWRRRQQKSQKTPAPK